MAAEIVAVLKSGSPSPTAADLASILPGLGADALRPLRGDLAALAAEWIYHGRRDRPARAS